MALGTTKKELPKKVRWLQRHCVLLGFVFGPTWNPEKIPDKTSGFKVLDDLPSKGKDSAEIGKLVQRAAVHRIVQVPIRNINSNT